MISQKIRTFLWYNQNAEEAATFYCSLFPNSQVLNVTRYPPGGPSPAGTAMTVVFRLDGVEFVALNGGPHFQFNEAISLAVRCQDQREVDRLWDALTLGGQPSRCGWLKDRYGLSWQIVPQALTDLLASNDAAVADRVMGAMLQMTKIDIAALERAADGV